MDQVALFDWAGLDLPPPENDVRDIHGAQRYSAMLARPVDVEVALIPVFDAQQLELDLAGQVTPIVPKTRYGLLALRLTEFLLRSCGAGFVRHGFVLEKQGIAFLGDLVQMQDFTARRRIRSKRFFHAVRETLFQNGLDFGMVAPRWERPIDGFTHRHWVHCRTH